MNENFFEPQRQSKIGIILIFSVSLFHIIRNLWFLGVYILVQDIKDEFLIYGGIGLVLALLLALGYSIFYYLNFIFYIDKENKAFVLKKGVFSSDVVTIPFNKIQQVNFKRNILQNILGVYSVVIDTAGSAEKEVEIKAMSRQKADVFSELLLELSSKETADEPIVTDENQESENLKPSLEWEYKLPFSSILKLGLTSNYLRGLAVLLAFYFNITSQFHSSSEFPVNLNQFEITGFLNTIFVLLLLVFIGFLFTLGETFIKYYNLHLRKLHSGLQVEMGLKNNTKVNLRAERVQLLQEISNPLQKKLDLYKLKLSLGSSKDSLQKDQIKMPGLPEEIVQRIKTYIYTREEIKEEFKIYPQPVLLTRNIFKAVIPILIALVILEISTVRISLEWISAIILLFSVLWVVFQYFYFKTITLSVSEDFLVKNSGLWNRKKQFLEMYKLQAVSVSRSIWYRKNLVNIIFHSAGGDISYSLIDKKEAIPLVNYLLYKIEVTSKPWM